MLKGLGFRVCGLGFRVQSSWFRALEGLVFSGLGLGLWSMSYGSCYVGFWGLPEPQKG